MGENMEKDLLRDTLFEKYFEIEEGIKAIDLANKLSFIPDTWRKLHILCEKNIDYFDSYCHLGKFSKLNYKQKQYLVLKLKMFCYLIIDIERKKTITDESMNSIFDQEFFVNNFNEIKISNKNWTDMYNIEHYSSNPDELIDLYEQNHLVFSLSSRLYYRLEIDKAWTFFTINFVNAYAQMGFQTPNQFLYEQLYLQYNLLPSRIQDAQSRIGIEKMHKMFEKIPDIKLPIEIIPEDLYKQYLKRCSTNKLEKIKIK